MTFDTDLDCYGGSPKIKECVKIVKDMLENDLVDIWRIRNLNKHRYTWRNSSSKLLRRLDFWLISDNLQEDIKQTEIGPSMKSDHSLIRWAWLPRQPDHLMFYKPHSDARKKIPAKMREVV